MPTLKDITNVLKRLKRNKTAILGLGIVLFFAIISLFAPIISPYDPYEKEFFPRQPPSLVNLLGTDAMGRDVFSRVVWGGRITFVIAIVAAGLSTLIGAIVGAFSGYCGGKIDFICMRIADTILVIPSFFFFLLFVTALPERSILISSVVLSLLIWPRMARIIRSEVLSIKEQPYILAARSLGLGGARILLRHVMPNTVSLILVVFTMDLSGAVLIMQGFDFLGLGDPTSLSWGTLMASGRSYLAHSYWITTYPGLFLFLLVLGMNLLGDGLRDALDPRLRQRMRG